MTGQRAEVTPLQYIHHGIKITDLNFRTVALYSLVFVAVVEVNHYVSASYQRQSWQFVAVNYGAMALTAALVNILTLLWLKRSIFALYKGLNYPDPGSIIHSYKRFFLPLLATAVIQLILPALSALFPIEEVEQVSWRMEIEILSILLGMLFLPPYIQFLEGFLVLSDTGLWDAIRMSSRQILQRFPEFMGIYFALVGVNTLILLLGLEAYTHLPVRVGLAVVQAYVTVAVCAVAYLFFMGVKQEHQPTEG